MDTELKEPRRTQAIQNEGGIWVKNFKLKKAVSDFVSTMDIDCPKCHTHFQHTMSEAQEADLNEALVNHVLVVKVRSLREKHIAIFNPKKCLSTHPDYFLYVYQAYTGAPAVYPFSTEKPDGAQRVAVEATHHARRNSVSTTPPMARTSSQDTDNHTHRNNEDLRQHG